MKLLHEKGVLKKFAKFPLSGLFIQKETLLSKSNLIKRFRHRRFPVNFAKFLKATIA